MRLALGSVLAAVAAFVHTSAPASRIVFAADRLPLSMGEIYRVSAGGGLTNLTHDPASDVQATASPDGKWIAFARVRLATAQVLVVGSDGHGLRAVSPVLPQLSVADGGVNSIAWSADSRTLAVMRYGSAGGSTAVYVTGLHGGWHLVGRGAVGQPAAWSDDGTRLAFSTSSGLVRVVRPDGRALWSAGGEGTPAWSRAGLLAVQQNSTTTAVYDASGKLRGTFPGRGAAWHENVLATVRSGTLELRTNGAGRPTLRATLVAGARPDDDVRIDWLGGHRLRVFDRRFVVYDTATHRRSALSPGMTIYDGVFSATGTTAWWRYDNGAVQLLRGSRVLRTEPACGDDTVFDRIQFLGRTTAFVYESGCLVPSADLYSVAPDGTGLQRLTKTPQHEFDPATSPDGTRIAYVQQAFADRCQGCAQSIWVSSPTLQLTHPKDTDTVPFGDGPTWSPDGTQIVFAQSGLDTPWSLQTVPAAGGAATPLGIPGQRPVWGPKLLAFEVDGLPPKLETYDPTTHATTVVAKTTGRDPVALAWSQDGRLAYLANSAKDQWITIVGGAAFDVSKLLPRYSVASGLAWSPDGTQFAIAAKDANGLGEVWTLGVDGRGLHQVTRNLDVVGNLSWR